MRKFLSKYLPHHETVKANRWLRPFGAWLQQPNLWQLHRHSVAGGVAIGLFCGLIPGPLQMMSAVLLAVLLRVNLPVALLTTLYTNPFTIVPLYLMAYQLGAWISGAHNGLVAAHLAVPTLHWDNWISESWNWIAQLGKPLLIGLPLLAAILAIFGYVAVRLIWRIAVIFRWRTRQQRQKCTRI
jgi:uncharacterized protein (DUF2062 family)